MTKICKFLFAFCFGAGMTYGTGAWADTLTVTLSSPIESGMAGSNLSFFGTVSAPSTNTSPVYLLSDSYNVGTPLSVDDSPFLNNFPLTLSPGQSVSDVLFSVGVPLASGAGTYLGSFTVGGSSNGISEDFFVTDSFQVQVTPEPSTLAMWATSLLGVAAAARRRRAGEPLEEGGATSLSE
jgi:hypothetical protein